MKITIEQAKQQITEGFSSILTREDVLHLLDCIEVKSEFALTETQIHSLSVGIASEISDGGIDIIQDYDLTMNYKEVELDSVDYSLEDIQNLAERAIKDFIETMNENE